MFDVDLNVPGLDGLYLFDPLVGMHAVCIAPDIAIAIIRLW